MKHIKLFESFQQLYRHITEDELQDIDNRTNLDFDNNLINKISERLNPNFRLRVRNLNNRGIVHLDISHYDMGSNWEIWQTSDEWFIVNLDHDGEVDTGGEYFECDTFEGLLQLLEDHEVIN